MNAGGVSKACKSNGPYEITSRMVSGRRERNALVTYPGAVNNPPKGGLIHDMDAGTYVIRIESSGTPGGAYVLSASW